MDLLFMKTYVVRLHAPSQVKEYHKSVWFISTLLLSPPIPIDRNHGLFGPVTPPGSFVIPGTGSVRVRLQST